MKRHAVLCFLCLWPAAASAGEVSSAYSTFAVDQCTQISAPAEEFSGGFLCEGHGGLKVYFAEGDLRTLMAYGREPQNHCSAQQTFSGFNTVNTTIEWRLDDGKPFAAIQRWSVSYDPEDPEKLKTWLGITRIEDGNSCRVAVVEGALPKANEIARQVADDLARSFNCASDAARVISQEAMMADQLMSGTPCTQP